MTTRSNIAVSLRPTTGCVAATRCREREGAERKLVTAREVEERLRSCHVTHHFGGSHVFPPVEGRRLSTVLDLAARKTVFNMAIYLCD